MSSPLSTCQIRATDDRCLSAHYLLGPVLQLGWKMILGIETHVRARSALISTITRTRPRPSQQRHPDLEQATVDQSVILVTFGILVVK